MKSRRRIAFLGLGTAAKLDVELERLQQENASNGMSAGSAGSFQNSSLGLRSDFIAT
jgi:hypothetical protein